MKTSSVDLIILELLSKEHAHLNSLQIFNEVRKRLPAINQSTVYRSLDRLVKKKKVSVSDMGTGSDVYELISNDLHHHLVCHHCGKVTTIGHIDVLNFFKVIEKNNNFKVITNHLVLFGLCNECQNKDDENKDK